jgi:hypothetical protein
MFYSNNDETCFEAISRYYPRFLLEVREMRAVLEAEGSVAGTIKTNINQVSDNCFIDTADETTIRSLEEYLYLSLYKDKSLEERRRLVKSYFVGNGKISADMISEMISAYTGATVTCRFEPFDIAGNNKLFIDFERGEGKTLYMGDILSLLKQRIPAHIEYRAAVTYRFPVVAERRKTNYLYGFELCGTKPESTTLGFMREIDSVSGSTETGIGVNYPPCGTRYAG